MGSLKLYATVAGCLAAASTFGAAQAADLLSPPPPPPLAEPIADVGGGWYLRGDVGVSHYEGGKFSNPAIPNASFYGEDMGSGAFAGVGIGYQFNSWFRMDATGEYRFSTGVKAVDRDAVGNFLGYEKYSGNYSAGLFLVNAYFDLGTWYGFTPFVGAGIGYAHNNLRSFETSTIIVSPFGGASGGTIRNKSHGDLAWALHAGIGYDVTPNVKLELGYRYVNMGKARTGLVDCFCGTVKPGFHVKDIESHDIKLGMRWALGGPAAPAYEPAPLMRKY
ncbi:outer membrane protein [Enterovirga rhinocerotis]|uniref:Opacity protein-like surface antigen n=1 Tax=Enterovirga rhinocerotis TaxID=1339210 RepID=A0A4R7CA24_9HYPH|nr:outer membrane beta-barrel protein [Enterovirga rhinocerotis]TDR94922.1 opacity protein-like surface antigen [Enterovirga rhinocerotis]